MAKNPKGSLSGNMEDYLEAILCIGQDQAAVRVRDIAKRMDITMPSVSGALKNLEKQGFVRHPRYDWIDLTDEGRRIATEVFNRHRAIRGFLTDVLEIDPKTAERDACGMEHSISEVTLDRLVRFMKTRPRPVRKKGA
jgi:DtxR family transcriptional regulator, Mn-dependent transcriptional regulator